MPTKKKEKGNEMVSVKLVSCTKAGPLKLASHAALKCYQAKEPKWGKLIDVENRLFGVGHHTTLQHTFFNFSIEGIAVGDVTFGLHLTHPFYNSDQRSGRYCAEMFLKPNFSRIKRYVSDFWPETSRKDWNEIIEYVKRGVALYHQHIGQATELAKDFIREERPFANEKYVEMSAPKIAQEQMRMFIPVIFPTGLDYTINTTVLAAMYRIAWTPSMRYVVDQMVKKVVKKFPELGFMFKKEDIVSDDWFARLPKKTEVGIKYKPIHKLLKLEDDSLFIIPKSERMHPVDLLHFDPGTMENNIGDFKSQVEISVATMGQDQRHRTVRRGAPAFTGCFYLPPILRGLKLEKITAEYMKDWINLSQKIPKTLAMILAPYGAMVTYRRRGSFNAIAHEQAKRLCWCAQEEIYHAGRTLRLGIEKKRGKGSELLSMFEPPCYRTGKCAEGGRYCGRDLRKRKTGDYFPERKV